MAIVPVRAPLAEGVNVTDIVQVAPPASDAPQVLVWAKSPALVPLRPMLLMVRDPAPLLVNVTVCAALVVPTF